MSPHDLFRIDGQIKPDLLGKGSFILRYLPDKGKWSLRWIPDDSNDPIESSPPLDLPDSTDPGGVGIDYFTCVGQNAPEGSSLDTLFTAFITCLT